MNVNKYKTVLCKHFSQTGTCSYGEKCQFAHGLHEIKNSNHTGGSQGGLNHGMNTHIMGGYVPEKVTKQPPNPSNFKIIKCKNWEANGTCKYGSVCTFAHGDTELRTKSDNNLQMSENAISMDTGFMPLQGNPYLMQDPRYIYNLMLQQQMQEMQMQGMNMNNIGLGTQGTSNSGSELNMNDMSNPYFMGMMMDPNQLSQMSSMTNMSGLGGNQSNFPTSTDTSNMNPNMFMGGNNNS